MGPRRGLLLAGPRQFPAFTGKQWVEGLVAQGTAVFRVEKPGMGDSRMDDIYTAEHFNGEVPRLLAD